MGRNRLPGPGPRLRARAAPRDQDAPRPGSRTCPPRTPAEERDVAGPCRCSGWGTFGSTPTCTRTSAVPRPRLDEGAASREADTRHAGAHDVGLVDRGAPTVQTPPLSVARFRPSVGSPVVSVFVPVNATDSGRRRGRRPRRRRSATSRRRSIARPRSGRRATPSSPEAATVSPLRPATTRHAGRRRRCGPRRSGRRRNGCRSRAASTSRAGPVRSSSRPKPRSSRRRRAPQPRTPAPSRAGSSRKQSAAPSGEREQTGNRSSGGSPSGRGSRRTSRPWWSVLWLSAAIRREHGHQSCSHSKRRTSRCKRACARDMARRAHHSPLQGRNRFLRLLEQGEEGPARHQTLTQS